MQYSAVTSEAMSRASKSADEPQSSKSAATDSVRAGTMTFEVCARTVRTKGAVHTRRKQLRMSSLACVRASAYLQIRRVQGRVRPVDYRGAWDMRYLPVACGRVTTDSSISASIAGGRPVHGARAQKERSHQIEGLPVDHLVCAMNDHVRAGPRRTDVGCDPCPKILIMSIGERRACGRRRVDRHVMRMRTFASGIECTAHVP